MVVQSKDIYDRLASQKKGRSKWQKAVLLYAQELVEENLIDEKVTEVIDGQVFHGNRWMPLEQRLLNGAQNWRDYSYSGNSLCYNADIAERLMTPSELKRWNSTAWDIDLLSLQSRALMQAKHEIMRAVRDITIEAQYGGKK